MKKLLCTVTLAALAVPVMPTGNANAFTLYEKDNFKYILKNDWQIQFRQKVGEDKDLDIDFDDLELKNRAEYTLSNGITAFGQLDFGFKNGANKPDSNDESHLEEAYLGFEFQSSSFLFGKTSGAADMFGVADAKENPVGSDVFDKFGATSGDDIIVIQTKIADMITLAADYEIAADSEKSAGNGEFFSLYAAIDISGLTIGTAFQNYEPSADKTTEGASLQMEDYNMYGISLAYDAKVFEIGVDYSIQEETDSEPERSMANIFLGAPVGESIALGAGYVMLESDDADEEENGWYANITYTFPETKVSLFAEVEGTDKDDSDMGFVAGMRFKF